MGLKTVAFANFATGAWIAVVVLLDVVLSVGVEPTLHEWDQTLNLARLPIPPRELSVQGGNRTHSKYWFLKPARLPVAPLGHSDS